MFPNVDCQNLCWPNLFGLIFKKENVDGDFVLKKKVLCVTCAANSFGELHFGPVILMVKFILYGKCGLQKASTRGTPCEDHFVSNSPL